MEKSATVGVTKVIVGIFFDNDANKLRTIGGDLVPDGVDTLFEIGNGPG